MSESICNEDISILHSKRTPQNTSNFEVNTRYLRDPETMIMNEWTSLRVGSDNICIFVRRSTARLGANHREDFMRGIYDSGRITFFAGLRVPAELLDRFELSFRNLDRDQGLPLLAIIVHHLFEPWAVRAMPYARVVPSGPDSDARTERRKYKQMHGIKVRQRAGGGGLRGTFAKGMHGEKGWAYMSRLYILELLRKILKMASGKAMFMQGGVVLHIDVRAAVIGRRDGLPGIHR